MNLSKSLYTKAIQCPKALWLKKYKKEVLTPPDATALARFEAGNVAGELVCELFPNGREVIYNPDDFSGMVATTKEWMQEGVEYIYEATFLYEGILVLVDVLKVTPDGLEIYEVKSSSSVKDIYLHDVSIQLYVLRELGYTVLSSNVIHIDGDYAQGDELDLDRLFKIVDVSDAVDVLQVEIPNRLKEFETYLADKENEPNIEIGSHCKKPYECDAKEYCWKVQRSISEYSVFNIFNLGSKKQIELYDKGIVNIEDIPDDYPMTAIQKQKVQNFKEQATFIDKEKIKDFLDTLTYPIYHLLSINENIKDLMFPFQKKYYVTPEMQGSYSIKYALPSLVPEMAQAYKSLNGIQNGSDAMNTFPKLSQMNEIEKVATRTALVEYCKLDTLAMVEVLKKLKNVI